MLKDCNHERDTTNPDSFISYSPIITKGIKNIHDPNTSTTPVVVATQRSLDQYDGILYLAVVIRACSS